MALSSSRTILEAMNDFWLINKNFLNVIKASLSYRQKQCGGNVSEVSAHALERGNLRQEFRLVNHATALPNKYCLPDTQDVVGHEEDLTTFPKPVIYSDFRAAFETEPPDLFDGQSVEPSDWVPIYERYCQVSW